MPDLDAKDGLARLPGGVPGGIPDARGQTMAARAIRVGRLVDVLVVCIAWAPAAALGVPALGYTLGAGAWLLQRGLAVLDRRWITSSAEPRTQLGLNLFEAFARIWLLAGAIVAAGVIGGRADGLTAAVVIFSAYTLAFAVRLLSGPPGRPPARRFPPSARAAGGTR